MVMTHFLPQKLRRQEVFESRDGGPRGDKAIKVELKE